MLTKAVQVMMTNISFIRYTHPLEGLKDHAIVKGVLSSVLWVVTYSLDIFHSIEDMFSTPAELVLLLLISIIVDFATGIKSAKDNKTYLTSIGLRQTWIKFLEYAAGLVILTGIANVFGGAGIDSWVGRTLGYLEHIHYLGYFYATFTELKSIQENMAGKEDGRLAKMLNMIEDKIFDETEDQ